MSNDIEAANRDVLPEIEAQITWFVPEDEKHLVPLPVIGAIAGILIDGFLKGFISEAAEEAGRSAFKGLRERITKAFKDPQAAQSDEAAHDAQRSREIARSLSSEKRAVLMHRTETILQESLVEFMPDERAAVIVSRVRTSVVTNILERKDD